MMNVLVRILKSIFYTPKSTHSSVPHPASEGQLSTYIEELEQAFSALDRAKAVQPTLKHGESVGSYLQRKEAAARAVKTEETWLERLASDDRLVLAVQKATKFKVEKIGQRGTAVTVYVTDNIHVSMRSWIACMHPAGRVGSMPWVYHDKTTLSVCADNHYLENTLERMADLL